MEPPNWGDYNHQQRGRNRIHKDEPSSGDILQESMGVITGK